MKVDKSDCYHMAKLTNYNNIFSFCLYQNKHLLRKDRIVRRSYYWVDLSTSDMFYYEDGQCVVSNLRYKSISVFYSYDTKDKKWLIHNVPNCCRVY